MAEIRYQKQAEELQELLHRSNLSADELATRAILKTETFRKYIGGHMPCGARSMAAIRSVVEMEVERMNRAAAKEPPGALHDEMVNLAGQLLRLPEDKQKLARSLIEQLSTEQKASSKIHSLSRKAGAKAAAAVKNPAPEPPRSDKAVSPSGKIASPGEPSPEHRAPRQTPPNPSPK